MAFRKQYRTEVYSRFSSPAPQCCRAVSDTIWQLASHRKPLSSLTPQWNDSMHTVLTGLLSFLHSASSAYPYAKAVFILHHYLINLISCSVALIGNILIIFLSVFVCCFFFLKSPDHWNIFKTLNEFILLRQPRLRDFPLISEFSILTAKESSVSVQPC